MILRTKDRSEAKPSVARSGHWRNKFWSGDGWADCDPEAIKIDSNTCIMSDQYPTEADAERDGREMVQNASDPADRWHDPSSPIIYLGPVFFPTPHTQEAGE